MNGFTMFVTDEDREAAEWVRDHGGLDHVREEWRSRVPYDRYERRRQNLLRHIAECETALGRRRESINAMNRRIDYLTCERDELRKRAMPDGYEWPRYESGEMVQIGDDVVGRFSVDAIKVRSIEFRDGDTFLREGCKTDRTILVRPGERVKRPAVLAADGEPLEVGQTVWSVDSGTRYTVEKITDELIPIKCRSEMGSTVSLCPSQLTHQRPVLDADGVPIREGDTVWSVKYGTEYRVGEIRDTTDDDDEPCKIIGCSNDELHIYCAYFPPDKLTHTKPEIDTWERLEEDACKGVCDYFHAYKCDECEHVEGGCCKNMARDLVRRAKALAGGARGDSTRER